MASVSRRSGMSLCGSGRIRICRLGYERSLVNVIEERAVCVVELLDV